jgi:hypothetical protein
MSALYYHHNPPEEKVFRDIPGIDFRPYSHATATSVLNRTEESVIQSI